jgi:PatG C-terminal/PatG Domain
VGKKAPADVRKRHDVTGVANPAATENNFTLAEAAGCRTCGLSNPSLGTQMNATGEAVYAVGVLRPQIPTLGVAAAFAQLTEGTTQGDQVEVEHLQRLLRNPESAYLGRHLCWRFASGGLDTFTVLPQSHNDVERLAEVLSPAEAEEVVHVIVGRTVPDPTDWRCAASGLPAVQADRVMAFTLSEFAAAMPDGEPSVGEQPSAGDSNGDRTEFEAVVREVFLRLTRRTGNRGLAPEDIACNHVAVEYPAFHRMVWQARRDGKVLMAIDTQHSHSADRLVVAIRATFRDPRTHITERLQLLDDVTEPSFPFLLTGLERVF